MRRGNLLRSTNRLCKQFSEAFCHKVLKAFFGAMWVKDGAGTSGLKYVAEYGLFIACASCHCMPPLLATGRLKLRLRAAAQGRRSCG